MKPTTQDNQVVLLIFGSSLFLHFEISLERTQGKRGSNGPETIYGEVHLKEFLKISRKPAEKRYKDKKWKKNKTGVKGFSTKFKKAQKEVTHVNEGEKVSNTNKLSCIKKRHLQTSPLGTVSTCKNTNTPH